MTSFTLAYEADSPSRWAHIQAYRIYEVLNEDDDLELTDENCAVIQDLMFETMLEKIRANPNQMGSWRSRMWRMLHDADVGEWLRDEKRHSPWVDEIAIERAMRFDWGVIDNLTDVEWRVFAQRAADRPDWRGELTAAFTPDLLAAWRKGTPEQRGSVILAVKSARRRMGDIRPPVKAVAA